MVLVGHKSKKAVSCLFRQHKSLEADVNPAWGFLDPHTQAAAGASEFLTPGMRMIVVSWMVEVAEEFRMQQETLHLAVGLLDRFLCTSQVCPFPADMTHGCPS
mgnify:CR=1 FL=1